MISKNCFAVVAVALAVTAFSTSALVRWNLNAPGPRASTAWVFKARSLSDLSAHSGAIVVATAGASMHSRFAFSDGGEDSLPFEITEFTVLRSVVGPEPGSMIQVERAGGLDADGVTQVEIDADGGAFERGATYVLFLREQEEGPFYYQVNDQARYRVRNDRLESLDHDDVVCGTLQGQSTLVALDRIERSLP